MPTTQVTVPSAVIAELATVAEPAVTADSPAERGWYPKDNGFAG